MRDWSLTSGVVPLVLTGVGALAGLGLLVGRGRSWWLRRIPVALLLGLVSGVGVVVVVDVLWRPFPDPLPRVVAVWLGLAVAAAALAVPRPGSWRAKAVAPVALLLVVLAGAVQVNGFFGAYPTIRAAFGLPLPNQVDAVQLPGTTADLVAASPGAALSRSWAAPAGLPTSGAVSTANIPGTVSGFTGREAWLYLPPAYMSRPRAQLPVLVLLPGQPGGPRDWLDGGRLATTMNTFAAAHAGLAPVVVVADPLGSQLGQTLCVDSKAGHAYTYLSVDVPAWIRAHLQVNPDPRNWAIGGFSAGGTCALQLAVNAPTVYPTFLDISGQDEPTVGTRARTIAELFAGDAAAFKRVNPLDVLATRRFPGSAGLIVAGRDDAVYRPQAKTVLAAARSAGMRADYLELPGGHSWRVWAAGLENGLQWVATRTGLTP
jgi:S-formylglutathione hydrolase FrmB